MLLAAARILGAERGVRAARDSLKLVDETAHEVLHCRKFCCYLWSSWFDGGPDQYLIRLGDPRPEVGTKQLPKVVESYFMPHCYLNYERMYLLVGDLGMGKALEQRSGVHSRSGEIFVV